jgi:hypothetical protein
MRERSNVGRLGEPAALEAHGRTLHSSQCGSLTYASERPRRAPRGVWPLRSSRGRPVGRSRSRAPACQRREREPGPRQHAAPLGVIGQMIGRCGPHHTKQQRPGPVRRRAGHPWAGVTVEPWTPGSVLHGTVSRAQQSMRAVCPCAPQHHDQDQEAHHAKRVARNARGLLPRATFATRRSA